MKALGDVSIDTEALAEMQNRGGQWAAYQNQDLGHSEAGHLQFLRYGEGCTYEIPPTTYPQKAVGGWRYRHIGSVDLVKGVIE